MKRILIIDDDPDTCTLLSRYLEGKGFQTDTSFCGNKGIQKIKENRYDVVLSDYRLGDKEGLDIIREIKQFNSRMKVIIMTAYSDIRTAINVIKEGAFDYITKPMIPEEVANVINKACLASEQYEEVAVSTKENRQPQNGHEARAVNHLNDDYIRGTDPVMQNIYHEIDLVAPTNYSVIVYGESGTGKEIIARTIHNQSPRAKNPFIAMDCGTLSKDLAGSELFGHVKGAFTGAINDKPGHFEMANGGTLFLDEIANLSYEIQASLLRVIQERKFKRIGGTKEIKLDIRILVASNENLKEAYEKGKFREDLYHRLNEFSIVVPPLRDHKLDIPLFADYFLEKVNRELEKNVLEIEKEALNSLIQYSWPGNIREMKNVIRRAVLVAKGSQITKEHLPWYPYGMENQGTNEFNQVTVPATKHRFENSEVNLKENAEYAEYETIMNVLHQVNFNKSKAAMILKIDRKTLYNKLKRFDESFFNEGKQ